MTKKTQAQTPEEIAQAFLQLWQDKWNETLQKKGWPKDAPPPGLGQMPFFNPFMPMGGMQSPFMSDNNGDTVSKLEARISVLEKRISMLEPQAVKKTVKKPPVKVVKKSAKKPAKSKKTSKRKG